MKKWHIYDKEVEQIVSLPYRSKKLAEQALQEAQTFRIKWAQGDPNALEVRGYENYKEYNASFDGAKVVAQQ